MAPKAKKGAKDKDTGGDETAAPTKKKPSKDDTEAGLSLFLSKVIRFSS